MPKKHTIKIKPTKKRTGHNPHKSGSGQHDSRPKRKRTRQKQEESWKNES